MCFSWLSSHVIYNLQKYYNCLKRKCNNLKISVFQQFPKSVNTPVTQNHPHMFIFLSCLTVPIMQFGEYISLSSLQILFFIFTLKDSTKGDSSEGSPVTIELTDLFYAPKKSVGTQEFNELWMSFIVQNRCLLTKSLMTRSSLSVILRFQSDVFFQSNEFVSA